MSTFSIKSITHTALEINILLMPDTVSDSRRFVPVTRNLCRSSLYDVLLKFENLTVIVTGRKRILSVTQEIVPHNDRWPTVISCWIIGHSTAGEHVGTICNVIIDECGHCFSLPIDDFVHFIDSLHWRAWALFYSSYQWFCSFIDSLHWRAWALFYFSYQWFCSFYWFTALFLSVFSSQAYLWRLQFAQALTLIFSEGLWRQWSSAFLNSFDITCKHFPSSFLTSTFVHVCASETVGATLDQCSCQSQTVCMIANSAHKHALQVCAGLKVIVTFCRRWDIFKVWIFFGENDLLWHIFPFKLSK